MEAGRWVRGSEVRAACVRWLVGQGVSETEGTGDARAACAGRARLLGRLGLFCWAELGGGASAPRGLRDAAELGWSGGGNGRPQAELRKRSRPRVGLEPEKEKDGHGPVGLLPWFGFPFFLSFSISNQTQT